MLLGHVVANHTAGGCSHYGMVAGIVSGNTANYRALDAAFGLGRNRRDCKGQCQHRAPENRFHVGTSSVPAVQIDIDWLGSACK